jgi:hypothetical protein
VRNFRLWLRCLQISARRSPRRPGERGDGGGAAEAKAKSYENARDNIKEEGIGAAPVNNVGSGAIAGTGGAGGEPGVSKKRNPTLSYFKRKTPKV